MAGIPAFETVRQLEDWFEKLPEDQQAVIVEDLDLDVHDAKGEEAATINNDGIGAQAAYLGLAEVETRIREIFMESGWSQ